MPPKYGNLTTFPSHNFDFHGTLNFQGVVDMISDNGFVYPDLVKDFFANFSVDPDFVLTSRVKNTEIVLSLEDLG